MVELERCRLGLVRERTPGNSRLERCRAAGRRMHRKPESLASAAEPGERAMTLHHHDAKAAALLIRSAHADLQGNGFDEHAGGAATTIPSRSDLLDAIEHAADYELSSSVAGRIADAVVKLLA